MPVTESRVNLEGGDKSALMTPRRCGTYEVVSTFTSHAGETVEHTLPIKIAGCPARPGVARLRVEGGRLRWALSQGDVAEVVLLRRDGGRWKEVRRRTVTGTSLPLTGLRPGAYRALVRAVAGDRASRTRAVRFRLRG